MQNARQSRVAGQAYVSLTLRAILFNEDICLSIYLVRHADKENGDYYSPSLPMNNQPISELGKKQASKLVHYFHDIKVTSIYVSEYSRTTQTIKPVSEKLGIVPTIDNRLNEINIGNTDRLSEEQIKEKYPVFWKQYKERTEDFTFPNGENGEEAASRIFSLFSTLSKDDNTILVAHDGIIRLLICRILGMPVYRRHQFQIDLASISKCDYDTGFKSWRISVLNYSM